MSASGQTRHRRVGERRAGNTYRRIGVSACRRRGNTYGRVGVCRPIDFIGLFRLDENSALSVFIRSFALSPDTPIRRYVSARSPTRRSADTPIRVPPQLTRCFSLAPEPLALKLFAWQLLPRQHTILKLREISFFPALMHASTGCGKIRFGPCPWVSPVARSR